MRAVPVASRTSAPILPTDLNNLRGYGFGTRIAHTSAKRIAGWSSGCWEAYVKDCQLCPDVGPLVWRAAVRQGIQLRRLRAVWLVVGT